MGFKGLPRVKEKTVQQQCLDWLFLWGAFPVRINSGGVTHTSKAGKKRFVRFNSEEGCSDTLVCLPGGRFMALEVKRPGEEPTLKQRSFLAAVEKRKGLGVWADSLDELKATLRDAGYRVD